MTLLWEKVAGPFPTRIFMTIKITILHTRENQKRCIWLVSLTGQFEEKKRQMIRYEIIAKFCHYTESLGAFIYGFHKQHLVTRRESKILSTISDYKVRQIDDEYRLLTKGKIDVLWKIQEHSLKNIFGYYKTVNPQYSNIIFESLLNIKKLLKEIYDCYSFYKDSYNSYKHGYRLWFGRDQKIQRDIIVYIPTLRYEHKRKRRDYVPTDEDSLSIVLNAPAIVVSYLIF